MALPTRFIPILMVLLPWHWVNPYSRPVRIAVLFLVIFHAAAGVRVMLLDFGLGRRHAVWSGRWQASD